jgi:pimeloyl-ACP methyl ester carboxylesterase
VTAVWPIRAAFAVLGRTAPGLAARWALDLFFTPQGRRRSRRARAFLATGRRFDVWVQGSRVAGWSWGEGPNVYLVHGWAGVGGQMAAFGPPLVANGFRVVAFDAPGHGASEGRRSSIVHFARALRAIAAQEGEAYAVIAHSLGAAATVHALSEGLRIARAVFVGPTAGPLDWADRFRNHLGIPTHVMDAMRERSERWLGLSWEQFDIPRLARSQALPLLVFHDRNDVEVPWKDGAAIATAWPGARLVTTTGLGHQRILRDPRVVSEAVSFVRGAASSRPGRCAGPDCENPLAEGDLCETCSLEQSLYHRDHRWVARATEVPSMRSS